jgi:protein-tyrosine phosphatase
MPPTRPAAGRAARVSVCFVCLGNICRSPTAEAVFRALLAEAGLEDRIHVESAGTADYHVGEPPDARSRAAARARGIRVDGRGRQFGADDFVRFDRVIAMDRANERALLALAPGDAERLKVVCLRRFEEAPDALDVPDPYYGESGGFDRVLDICDAACRGLLAQLRREHGLP